MIHPDGFPSSRFKGRGLNKFRGRSCRRGSLAVFRETVPVSDLNIQSVRGVFTWKLLEPSAIVVNDWRQAAFTEFGLHCCGIPWLDDKAQVIHYGGLPGRAPV